MCLGHVLVLSGRQKESCALVLCLGAVPILAYTTGTVQTIPYRVSRRFAERFLTCSFRDKLRVPGGIHTSV